MGRRHRDKVVPVSLLRFTVIAWEVVLNQIKQNFEQHIVLGVVNDKDLEEILPLFPKGLFITSKPNNQEVRRNNLSRKKQEQTELARTSIQLNYSNYTKKP
jgi:folylpolyglutamate synthase/dihydropteroate synthase